MFTIFSANLPEPASVGTEKTVYEFPAGTLDYEHPLSTAADEHKFTLNGVDYICNDLIDGTTKIKVAYRENNLDVIALEMFRTDGSVKITIRHTVLESHAGDPFALIYLGEMPEQPKYKGVIVKLVKDKTALVTYDDVEGKYKLEEV